jgi:DNA polymerase III alpha subunit (gram-positive type)
VIFGVKTVYMQQSLFGSVLSAQEHPSAQSKNTSQKLADVLFTVVDLETTGLSAKKNAITEIVAIQYLKGVEQAMYSSLVKPTETITEEITRFTGITNEMVDQAPSVLSVLNELCQFSGSYPVIVGHNISFDIKFIREKLEQNAMGSLQSIFDLSSSLCTKTLAQKCLPGLPSYQGIVVATHLGVSNPNPHRAEYDVRMSAGILFALLDKLSVERPDIQTLSDLLAYQGPLSER